MSIPDYQTIMLPLLQLFGDGEEHHMRELTEMVSDHFELSDGERQERLPSGQSTVIANRVGWAKTYLKNAGLFEQPRRGIVQRTESVGYTAHA